MEIVQFVAEALGDASYLVVSGSEAVAIDPQRDVRPYLAAAEQRGVTITRVFETHVHNDYISGGPELVARGAEIVAPEDAGLEFAHRPIADGEQLPVGAGHIRAVRAPGHTHHHTAYLAIDEAGTVLGAFTGGSIIIGGAGRSDLLGPDHTEELTRQQWNSAQRITALMPEDAELLPTHGAGSFCSSQQCGGERRAPLREERVRNIVLASPNFEAFRTLHLANPAPIPGYYRHMAPINREGPRVYGDLPSPSPLSPDAALGAVMSGSRLLDVRSRFDFATAHVPASTSIEEGESMLAYVGWVMPFNQPLVLVTNDAAQADRVTVDLLRIGYEEVTGSLPFARLAADRPAAQLDVVSVAEAATIRAAAHLPGYDVRFDSDLRTLPLPGSQHRPIDRIADWLPNVEDDAMLVSCAAGSRAATAASLLQAAGHHPRVLLEGGAVDLVAAVSAIAR
ncbi:MAG: MBL fold metallo-hydrolase [Chloroflexi bacterium]|nr:MBL fold metallo-hydrolase [Chloroflexota bacterium]MDA1146967.1 MBL fold metallo-hydrolase [Chloroflexota bacterium]